MDTRKMLGTAVLSAAMIFGAVGGASAQGPVRHGRHGGVVVVQPVAPPRVVVRPPPVVVAPRPPMPARRAEMRPHVMRHGYAWVDGAWQWNGAQWAWIPGHFQPVAGPRVVVRR